MEKLLFKKMKDFGDLINFGIKTRYKWFCKIKMTTHLFIFI